MPHCLDENLLENKGSELGILLPSDVSYLSFFFIKIPTHAHFEDDVFLFSSLSNPLPNLPVPVSVVESVGWLACTLQFSYVLPAFDPPISHD